MRYVTDLKRNTTLAEFDAVEADWRETAERQVENLEGYWYCPTPGELDDLSADKALSEVEYAVAENVQLARNIEADVTEWGKVAVARIKARAKAQKRAAKVKTWSTAQPPADHRGLCLPEQLPSAYPIR
jgi:hypothetical protein